VNRLIALAALAIPFTFALGCTEIDPTDSTDLGTTSQAVKVECTSDVVTTGQWPSIQAWNGKVPPSAGPSQVFVIAPLAGYNNQYILITQVNWEQGVIPWAAWAPASSRSQVMATFSGAPGDIDALGGTRVPPIGIKFPPGTDELRFMMNRAAMNFAPLPTPIGG